MIRLRGPERAIRNKLLLMVLAPLLVVLVLLFGVLAWGNAAFDRLLITRIQSDRVETNRGAVYTPEGWIILGRDQLAHTPAAQVAPAGEFQVGKKWEFRSALARPGDGNTSYDGVATVAALEDVSVPAGTFKAYRVEVVTSSRYGRRKRTYWMQPNWGFPIKLESKILSTNIPGIGQDEDTLVMVSRQRGPG